MNLFRSEEHAKNWSCYDPISEEAIMPLAELLHTLRELDREGSFWQRG
jgi:hypothetical protein